MVFKKHLGFFSKKIIETRLKRMSRSREKDEKYNAQLDQIKKFIACIDEVKAFFVAIGDEASLPECEKKHTDLSSLHDRLKKLVDNKNTPELTLKLRFQEIERLSRDDDDIVYLITSTRQMEMYQGLQGFLDSVRKMRNKKQKATYNILTLDGDDFKKQLSEATANISPDYKILAPVVHTVATKNPTTTKKKPKAKKTGTGITIDAIEKQPIVVSQDLDAIKLATEEKITAVSQGVEAIELAAKQKADAFYRNQLYEVLKKKYDHEELNEAEIHERVNGDLISDDFIFQINSRLAGKIIQINEIKKIFWPTIKSFLDDFKQVKEIGSSGPYNNKQSDLIEGLWSKYKDKNKDIFPSSVSSYNASKLIDYLEENIKQLFTAQETAIKKHEEKISQLIADVDDYINSEEKYRSMGNLIEQRKEKIKNDYETHYNYISKQLEQLESQFKLIIIPPDNIPPKIKVIKENIKDIMNRLRQELIDIKLPKYEKFLKRDKIPENGEIAESKALDSLVKKTNQLINSVENELNDLDAYIYEQLKAQKELAEKQKLEEEQKQQKLAEKLKLEEEQKQQKLAEKLKLEEEQKQQKLAEKQKLDELLRKAKVSANDNIEEDYLLKLEKDINYIDSNSNLLFPEQNLKKKLVNLHLNLMDLFPKKKNEKMQEGMIEELSAANKITEVNTVEGLLPEIKGTINLLLNQQPDIPSIETKAALIRNILKVYMTDFERDVLSINEILNVQLIETQTIIKDYNKNFDVGLLVKAKFKRFDTQILDLGIRRYNEYYTENEIETIKSSSLSCKNSRLGLTNRLVDIVNGFNVVSVDIGQPGAIPQYPFEKCTNILKQIRREIITLAKEEMDRNSSIDVNVNTKNIFDFIVSEYTKIATSFTILNAYQNKLKSTYHPPYPEDEYIDAGWNTDEEFKQFLNIRKRITELDELKVCHYLMRVFADEDRTLESKLKLFDICKANTKIKHIMSARAFLQKFTDFQPINFYQIPKTLTINDIDNKVLTDLKLTIAELDPLDDEARKIVLLKGSLHDYFLTRKIPRHVEKMLHQFENIDLKRASSYSAETTRRRVSFNRAIAEAFYANSEKSFFGTRTDEVQGLYDAMQDMVDLKETAKSIIGKIKKDHSKTDTDGRIRISPQLTQVYQLAEEMIKKIELAEHHEKSGLKVQDMHTDRAESIKQLEQILTLAKRESSSGFTTTNLRSAGTKRFFENLPNLLKIDDKRFKAKISEIVKAGKDNNPPLRLIPIVKARTFRTFTPFMQEQKPVSQERVEVTSPLMSEIKPEIQPKIGEQNSLLYEVVETTIDDFKEKVKQDKQQRLSEIGSQLARIKKRKDKKGIMNKRDRSELGFLTEQISDIGYYELERSKQLLEEVKKISDNTISTDKKIQEINNRIKEEKPSLLNLLIDNVVDQLESLNKSKNRDVKRLCEQIRRYEDKEIDKETMWENIVEICKKHNESTWGQHNPKVALLLKAIAEFRINLANWPEINTLSELIIAQQKRNAINHTFYEDWKRLDEIQETEEYSNDVDIQMKLDAYLCLRQRIKDSGKTTTLSAILKKDSTDMGTDVTRNENDKVIRYKLKGEPFAATIQDALYHKRGLLQATSKTKLSELRHELANPLDIEKLVVEPTLKQSLMFSFSVAYNYLLARDHHNLIIEGENGEGDIHLGALPMYRIGHTKVKQHKDILKDINKNSPPLGAIISVGQPWENTGTSFFEPVTPEKWTKWNKNDYQIKVMPVNVRDFTTKAKLEDIDAAVKLIDQTRKECKSVYVHCKAGRMRSVLILMCYLTTAYRKPGTNLPFTYEEALNHIESKRHHIDFKSEAKKADVVAYINHYKDPKRNKSEESLSTTLSKKN
jgi:hypothetical protein